LAGINFLVGGLFDLIDGSFTSDCTFLIDFYYSVYGFCYSYLDIALDYPDLIESYE
jgi:hypothetical protein